MDSATRLTLNGLARCTLLVDNYILYLQFLQMGYTIREEFLFSGHLLKFRIREMSLPCGSVEFRVGCGPGL
jgi:hypothetical protein